MTDKVSDDFKTVSYPFCLIERFGNANAKFIRILLKLKLPNNVDLIDLKLKFLALRFDARGTLRVWFFVVFST